MTPFIIPLWQFFMMAGREEMDVWVYH